MIELEILLPLVNNATLLLALGMLYELIGIHRRGSKLTFKQVLSGLILGLMSIVVMLNALNLGNGVIFDTRSVLLSLSGLFFGTLSTTIAMVIAAAFRLSQGGAGAWTGVLVILTTALAGVLWRHLRPPTAQKLSFIELYLFGGIVHVLMLLEMFTLPRGLWRSILPQITLPILGIYPLVTGLLGWLLSLQEQRRAAEESLRTSEERYRSLFANNHAVMLLIDPQDGQIVDANPAAEKFYGWSHAELVTKKISDINILSAEEVKAEMAKAQAQQRNHFFFKHRLASGEVRHVEVYSGPIKVDSRSLLYSIIHDITQRVEAEQERNLLTEVLTASLNEIYLFDGTTLRFQYVNRGALQNLQMTAEQIKQLTPLDLKPEFTPQSFAQLIAPLQSGEQPKIFFETIHRRADGSLYPVEVHLQYFRHQNLFLAVINDITERVKKDETLRHRLRELETLSKLSSALRTAEETEQLLSILLEETLQAFDGQHGAIWLYDPRQQSLRRAIELGWLANLDVQSQVFEKKLLDHLTAPNGTSPGLIHLPEAQLKEMGKDKVPDGWDAVCCPLQTTHELLGILLLALPTRRALSNEETRLLLSISEMASTALHRQNLHRETVKQLNHLQALREIDIAISSVFDLQLTLDVVCAQSIKQLNADAVGVLLYSPAEYLLKAAAARGFRHQRYYNDRVRLGEGLAGIAAVDKRLLHVTDLRRANPPFTRQKLLNEEGFLSYAAAPLLVKGQLKGVLEVFHRTIFQHTQEWLDLFQSFALQSAIAIDNAQMFEHLQQLNNELFSAYDATIEGWARVLELKDQETEGHCQRVVDWTLQLAQAMGINGEALIHIRRGALLHDIGKMGIPDAILFKAGPLNDEEWKIIRQHPRYAHDLLASISYLRPALDIPYCHHEKWDGSGYPRGLKGEEIPLSARIFAVIDVWDALTSDRPYRKAWSQTQALEYIRQQAGKHFDPKVVEVFLANVDRILSSHL
ncbi:MAG: hypothetical protein Kow0088_25660 [Anaerolineales bacterium]